ncbi:MAG: DUF3524 domain-containing protein [Oleiphilaceae bacterium]|nr:DUF3524 domain-containing protein [Oleiphilaceae bacterium]
MTTSAKPRILILSGYDAGSHVRWREQLVASQPQFEWHTLALPPRFFRWRIRGNALSWLDEPLLAQSWDLLVVTSMVDLAGVKAFHPALAATPSLLYMHENQFAYPDSGRQHSSAEPMMVNLYSALAANRVVFNSEWNRRSFLQGARTFLDKMPDAVPAGLIDRLGEKSAVIPVPIDDHLYLERQTPLNLEVPHLLWNHRWEYDKAPERLLLLLQKLSDAGQPFQVSVVGEQFRKQPGAFEAIRRQFGQQVKHWGFVDNRQAYNDLLASADVAISTALHDFQGLALLEAMASGCLALAPNRLAYPEYVAQAQLYDSHPDDAEREAASAVACLQALRALQPASPQPEAWSASQLQGRYRSVLEALLA